MDLLRRGLVTGGSDPIKHEERDLTDEWSTHSGITAGMFGVSAGIFALFFFSDVPKVRKDILQVDSDS